MHKLFICLAVCGMLALMPLRLYAQFTPSTGGGQIQFGQYYSVTSGITAINPDLLFGNIIAGDFKEIELGSGDDAVFEIEGLPFLDVIIAVTGSSLTGPNSGFLYLDGDTNCSDNTCRIPITYGYAFDNSGSTVPDALVANEFTINPVLYPMRRRAAGAPPGPPPTPDIAGVNLPSTVFSYLFIYGTLNSNAVNVVGSYEATLQIEVVYN